MRKLLLMCSLLLIFLSEGYAQSRKITGTVLDNSGNPVDQVTVSVVETQKSTLTDDKGHYSIEALTGQTLRFSYVGATPSSLKVTEESSIFNVRLEIANNDLNEIVVTGYQKERKKDLTGAVAVVDVAQIQDIPTGNPIKSLQGRVAGVNITSDGSPYGGATVRIRGIGTLGNNDPLYVIDGMPTKRGLQELNQDDIESIQILKDASSATIYGSRAANGVVIVTTKKAKKGLSVLNFDASTSIQFYGDKLQMLNTRQRGEAYWRAAINDRENPNNNQIYQFDWNNNFDNPVLNNVVLPEFIDAAKTMKPADTYWYDQISQPSILQSYNLSFSNGSEKGNSLVSLSYFDNKGIVKETASKKLTARVNSDYNFFNNRLVLGENLSVSYIKNDLIPVSDVLFSALVAQPVVPVHTVDGGWGGPASGMSDRQNPLRQIEDNKQNFNHFLRIYGNVYADLTIIPNLHVRSSYGVDYNGNYARTLRKSYVSGFLADPSNLLNTTASYDGNWVWQNTLTYNLTKDKHRVEFLLGQEQINYISQSFFANRQGYALENLDYAYLDSGSSNKDNGGNGSGNGLLSYFGKANYTFNDRYLASFTLRRDGSSRFGKENQFGFFPAFSLGWRLSEEKFIKDLIPAVSDLKLRYGWGKNGNQEIANNATYSLYSAIYGTDLTWDPDKGTAYDINGSGSGQLPSGFVTIQQGNDLLKWESTTQSNFGLDFGLFDNALSGSVDYFVKKTSDILISPAYLGVIGEGGSHFVNGASMENRGLEAIISYSHNINKDFSINLTGNFAKYSNKVTYLPEEVLTSYAGNGTDQNILGRAVTSTFGYVADGIFQSQSEIDAAAVQPGSGVGRIRFKDLNNDKIIDDKDRQYITNGQPDFTYGLNVAIKYKKFDLSFFVQGVQGLDVYNDFKYLTDFSSIATGINWGSRVLDAWTPQNPQSTIPALTLVDSNNENRTSTYFIENGSYLKLRNVQLTYSLDGAFKKINLKRPRVFIQGSNLFTIKGKGYTATDPENPNNTYPIPVITTVGFSASF